MTAMFPAQSVLAALADPTRRDLFERLARRPSSVGELTNRVGVSQPAVSQHLRVLRDAGLVGMRREGTRHIYHASPEGLAELRKWVEGMWDAVLGSFERFARDQEEADAGSH